MHPCDGMLGEAGGRAGLLTLPARRRYLQWGADAMGNCSRRATRWLSRNSLPEEGGAALGSGIYRAHFVHKARSPGFQSLKFFLYPPGV